MPEVLEQQEQKTITPAELIAQRNEREAALRSGKPVEEAKPEPIKEAVQQEEEKPIPAEPKGEGPKLPRSARREMNRMREQIGELRGQLEAFKALGVVPQGENQLSPKVNEQEPQRESFASDADYFKALGRWEAKQETTKILSQRDEELTQKQQEAAFVEQIQAMDAKMADDIKTLPDWDEVAKQSEEDEAPKIDSTKHKNLLRLVMLSDERARVLYHWAKHPDEMQAMLDVTDAEKLAKSFGRLEERVGKLYTPKQQEKAAQASEEPKAPKEDRTHPAEAQAGRNAADRSQVRLPRPSSEVSAKGGSAPPDEPAPGSPAWMAKRNELQYRTRY